MPTGTEPLRLRQVWAWAVRSCNGVPAARNCGGESAGRGRIQLVVRLVVWIKPQYHLNLVQFAVLWLGERKVRWVWADGVNTGTKPRPRRYRGSPRIWQFFPYCQRRPSCGIVFSPPGTCRAPSTILATSNRSPVLLVAVLADSLQPRTTG